MMTTDARFYKRITPWIARSRLGARFFSYVAHRVDGPILDWTDGRHSLTSLLTETRVITVTTTGAKSGQPRTLPLLGIPDADNIILIASNFGGDRNPAWYYNLRQHPQADVVYAGETRSYRAREATGAERQRLWQQAVTHYPGYADYELRAGERDIPVMLLEPVGGRTGK